MQKKQSRSFGTRLTRRYLNLSFTALHALNSSAIAASNRTACDATLTSNFTISSCRPILKQELRILFFSYPSVQNRHRKLRRTGAIATRSWQGGFRPYGEKFLSEGVFSFVSFLWTGKEKKGINTIWSKNHSIWSLSHRAQSRCSQELSLRVPG